MTEKIIRVAFYGLVTALTGQLRFNRLFYWQ